MGILEEAPNYAAQAQLWQNYWANDEKQQAQRTAGPMAAAGDWEGAQRAALQRGQLPLYQDLQTLHDQSQARLAQQVLDATQAAKTPQQYHAILDTLGQHGIQGLSKYRIPAGGDFETTKAAALAEFGKYNDYIKRQREAAEEQRRVAKAAQDAADAEKSKHTFIGTITQPGVTRETVPEMSQPYWAAQPSGRPQGVAGVTAARGAPEISAATQLITPAEAPSLAQTMLAPSGPTSGLGQPIPAPTKEVGPERKSLAFVDEYGNVKYEPLPEGAEIEGKGSKKKSAAEYWTDYFKEADPTAPPDVIAERVRRQMQKDSAQVQMLHEVTGPEGERAKQGLTAISEARNAGKSSQDERLIKQYQQEHQGATWDEATAWLKGFKEKSSPEEREAALVRAEALRQGKPISEQDALEIVKGAGKQDPASVQILNGLMGPDHDKYVQALTEKSKADAAGKLPTGDIQLMEYYEKHHPEVPKEEMEAKKQEFAKSFKERSTEDERIIAKIQNEAKARSTIFNPVHVPTTEEAFDLIKSAGKQDPAAIQMLDRILGPEGPKVLAAIEARSRAEASGKPKSPIIEAATRIMNEHAHDIDGPMTFQEAYKLAAKEGHPQPLEAELFQAIKDNNPNLSFNDQLRLFTDLRTKLGEGEREKAKIAKEEGLNTLQTEAALAKAKREGIRPDLVYSATRDGKPGLVFVNPDTHEETFQAHPEGVGNVEKIGSAAKDGNAELTEVKRIMDEKKLNFTDALAERTRLTTHPSAALQAINTLHDEDKSLTPTDLLKKYAGLTAKSQSAAAIQTQNDFEERLHKDFPNATIPKTLVPGLYEAVKRGAVIVPTASGGVTTAEDFIGGSKAAQTAEKTDIAQQGLDLRQQQFGLSQAKFDFDKDLKTKNLDFLNRKFGWQQYTQGLDYVQKKKAMEALATQDAKAGLRISAGLTLTGHIKQLSDEASADPTATDQVIGWLASKGTWQNAKNELAEMFADPQGYAQSNKRSEKFIRIAMGLASLDAEVDRAYFQGQGNLAEETRKRLDALVLGLRNAPNTEVFLSGLNAFQGYVNEIVDTALPSEVLGKAEMTARRNRNLTDINEFRKQGNGFSPETPTAKDLDTMQFTRDDPELAKHLQEQRDSGALKVGDKFRIKQPDGSYKIFTVQGK
jgi:hypothetical protein